MKKPRRIEEMMTKRRNSGKISKTTVATNCRNINYLFDKFETYTNSVVSVIGDFEKKKC